MMYRTCSDLLLDVHVALGTWSWFFCLFTGLGKRMDRLRALALSLSLFTVHIRCDSFRRFPCFLDFLGVLFYSWGGMDITFFKDLEAETIHVCIAWALLKYLGLFLFLFFVTPS
jgi:hypothetical protein